MRTKIIFAPVCAIRGHREHTSIAQRFDGNKGVQFNVVGCLRCDKLIAERGYVARRKIRG